MARNKMRVLSSLGLTVFGAIGMYVYAMKGRHAVERGESVYSMNQEVHRKYKEEMEARWKKEDEARKNPSSS